LLPNSICFLGFESFFYVQENKTHLIRYVNVLYVFSSKLDNLNRATIDLGKFLSIRNINLFQGFTKKFIFCPFKGFNILGWFFRIFKNHSPIGQINAINIKSQKIRLKLAIKNFIHLPVFNLIKYLNLLINNWSNVYGFSEFSLNVSMELDLYLNKLLWKWAKHRHPRRTNVWIYYKYWKYFLGKWKFFSFDITTSQTIFLNSHFMIFKELFTLSSMIPTFEFLNINKVKSICYKKFSQNMFGVYLFLWKKQNGVCLICKKEFTFRELLKSSICNVRYKDTFTNHFVLLHNYCKYI
jgi:RNA-directed DNA polymerase